MPSQRKKTLQEQGVPIPSKLTGPQARNRFTDDRPKSRPQSRSQAASATAEASVVSRGNANTPRQRYSTSAKLHSPAPGGIGLLAAEFFICIGLLILLFFAKSGDALPMRIMNTIKRGTLICAAFIILALISGIGDNANRVAKALGGLIVVAILLTTPIFGTNAQGDPSGVLVDIDNIIKNDWAPTDTHATPSSSDGTTPSSSNPSTPAQSIGSLAKALENALKQEASIIGNTKGPTGSNPASAKNIKTDVGNAAVTLLNGVIPGSGDLVKKLFGF